MDVTAGDLAVLFLALKVIRASKGDGVWLLKDPQAHLENPSALASGRCVPAV